ncbi:MAG TPA: hypothetical protein PKX91_06485 [Clostridia bacterium]|jgi:hypothetical protein|nr:hypothetical protein [Clostridia bacterium]
MLREEIKIVMSGFEEINTCSLNNNEIIFGKDIPLEPYIMRYLFKNILGFKVRFKIQEKTNYIIRFRYKGYDCEISHKKLSYQLMVNPIIKDNVLKVFRKVKALLEKYFIELSQIALQEDNYMLENNIRAYENRLEYIEERILYHKNNLQKSQEGKRSYSENIIKNIICELYGKYPNINLFDEHMSSMQILTVTYIECIFSYIEHVLTLLGVFKSYKNKYEYFHNFIKQGWVTKWEFIFENKEINNEEVKADINNDNVKDDLFDESKNLKDKAKSLKEKYRNSWAHGMFSKEKKIFIPIEGLGNYPMFMKEGRVVGLWDNNPMLSAVELLAEFKKIREQFDNILNEKFPCEMILLRGGVSVMLNINLYKKALSSSESAEQFVEEMICLECYRFNMDW